MIKIDSHAIDQYIERIIGVPNDVVGDNVREWSEKKIREAIVENDIVYHEKKELPPINIKDEVAVVVDEDDEGEGFYVPTVYHASVFKEKMKDDGEKEPKKA